MRGFGGRRWLSCPVVAALLLGLQGAVAAAPASSRETQQDPAQRMFNFAQGLEQEGNLRGAIDEYVQLVDTFPDSDRVDDALVRLVEAYRALGDIQRALERADQLVERFSGSPGAAAGLVLRAEIEMAAARTAVEIDRVRTDFGRVPRIFQPGTYPELVWRARARVRAGEASFLLGELEKAAGDFLLAVEDEALSEWTERARLGLANVFSWQGEWRPAMAILQSVVSDAAGGTAMPDAPATVARRRLELVYRLHLAPATGRPSWTASRLLSVSGVALDDAMGVAATDDGSLIVVLDGGDRALVVESGGAVTRRATSPDPRLPVWNGVVPYWVVKRSIEPLAGGSRLTFAEPRRGESEPRPLENLRAAVVGRYGEWFVIDEDPRRVLVFGEDGAFRRVLVGREERVEPYDLASDPRGQLYVLDRSADQVLRFGADGQRQGNAASGAWNEPEAVAVDVLGNVYVLDRGADAVLVYGRRGEQIAVLGPRLPGGIELRSPRDVAVDGSGRIYVADRDLDAVVVIE